MSLKYRLGNIKLEKIRLQKVISESGFCSRRKAEELIQKGRVKVNGRDIEIGVKVDKVKDLISIDGENIIIPKKQNYRYIILYKPRGYITTMKDENNRNRKCVADLITDVKERIYPVGRLDVNSEGLLLFTNDGDFANDIMHPRKHVTKTYRVTVRPDITDKQAADLSEGVEIDGYKTLPAEIRVLTKERNRVVIDIIIREGKNRQIRRMCEAVGLEVARLKRTSVGPLRLGMLKPGTYRDLKPDELRAIRTAISK